LVSLGEGLNSGSDFVFIMQRTHPVVRHRNKSIDVTDVRNVK